MHGAFNFTKGFLSSVPGQIKSTSGLQDFQFWRNKAPENTVDMYAHIGVEMTFGSIENIYSIFSGGQRFGGEQLQGDHRAQAGVLGLVDAVSLGYSKFAKGLKGIKGIKSTPRLWNNFQKSTRGVYSSRRAAANVYTVSIDNLNHNIRMHNKVVKMYRSIDNSIDPLMRGTSSFDELLNQLNK